MAQGFAAQVRAKLQGGQETIRRVFLDAAQTTFVTATRRQESAKKTGGSFETCKVPVDTGFLVGTAELRINDGVERKGVMAGEDSLPPDYALGLTDAKITDAVSLVFTAPYARVVEYGRDGVAGRFFVRGAAARWQQAVDQAVAKFKD